MNRFGVAALCVLAPLAGALAGGTVEGVVTYAGTSPKLSDKPVTTDKEACHNKTVPDEGLLVDAETKGLANVVITLKNVQGDTKPSKAEQVVECDQKHCVFTEHICVVPEGAEVVFKNSDTVGHNVNLKAKLNPGLNKTISVGESLKVKLDRKERIPIECSVHPWMQAWIVVVDTPYYAKTDAKGNFKIADLPAGTYKVSIWHEQIGAKKDAWEGPMEIIVKDGEKATAQYSGTGS